MVGSGPAGSIAALTLARGGARVALVDKAGFPRDKACGDLVGPRGVRLLEDLGVALPGARVVDDMVVVGPTGRRVRLPCRPGLTYPGRAIALPRAAFDAALHDAAVSAGAEAIVARAQDPIPGADGSLAGFELSSGDRVSADVVVGADGATSRVADAAGLVDPARVLWGFALRCYGPDAVDVPHILLWETAPRRGLPGYGWLFPGADGRSNFGLGVGVLADRTAGARAGRHLAAFTRHLEGLGLLERQPEPPVGRLGGWLKMGMVGTVPARGNVLLVGDAAGLVNPLQGEGISQAMGSGRAAAEAVLAGPALAADRYRRFLAATYAPYQSVTAPAHRAMLPRPRAVSAVGRLLTAPGISRVLAPAWSIFWNDLLDGAAPGAGRMLAGAATAIGRAAASGGTTRSWFRQAVGVPPAAAGAAG